MRKFRYKHEAEFSRSFVNHLRKKGWFVQRIESGTTGKGIPDIYAISPSGSAWWFELKRNHEETAYMLDQEYIIHWRPGQQAWLHEATLRKQNCATIACFDDVLLFLRHDKIYKNNKVIPRKDAEIATSLSELI